MGELLYRDEVYKIVGAAMEVQSSLGSGFLEAIYKEALGLEFVARGIVFEPEQKLTIRYKGIELKKFYCADLVCYGCIIVEVKATDKLIPAHEAQLLNYLAATGFRVGLLLNFGNSEGLEWKRMVR